MKTMTVKQYENIPIMIQDDSLLSFKPLSVGDKYKLLDNEEDIDKGHIVSLYEIIKKEGNKIESKIVIYKLT